MVHLCYGYILNEYCVCGAYIEACIEILSLYSLHTSIFTMYTTHPVWCCG